MAQRNPILGAGNSYVNVSKNATGGVVQTGDTLEIRTTYFFAGSYNSGSSNTLYEVRYFDNVPLKTAMITSAAESLRLITNEGVTFRKYTLAANDDPASYTSSPPAGQYQIRINIGQHNLASGAPGIPAAASAGTLTNITGAGNVRIGSGNTMYKPQLFGGLLITTAFRVRVTGAAGDTVVLGAGKFIYRKTSTGTDTTISSDPYKIYIADNNSSGLCANALGLNLASESGGTFGTGNQQNRLAGPTFFIPDYDYRVLNRSNGIGDGNYSFVNNLSQTNNTNFNARMTPNCNVPAGAIPKNDSCVHRMHGGFWDIIGDHTGTSNSTGNLAVASGATGGYMLVVNSDVVTSEAYRQTVTGLCPDTYYEFSAWIRNICKRCGIDSNSVSRHNPGALPNLAFSMNGLDRYTTGQMDTVGWQKKGFVFKTGPSETSALLSIRNNAPGGGGNDWAIDDIAIGTCGPAMNFNFKPFFLGCSNGSVVDLEDTVSYTFNPKYSWYKWQRSTNNGSTWSTAPLISPDSITIGPPVSGKYQFITKYPQFVAYGADSGHLYRVMVATSEANLNSASCSFTNGQNIMLKIITCPPVLDVNLLSLTGRLKDDKAILNWVVISEINIDRYEVEKSSDGVSFIKIAENKSRESSSIIEYHYNDLKNIRGNTYFRLKVFTKDGLHSYSKIILLNRSFSFTVTSVLNPFSDQISADIIMPADGLVVMNLFDSYGKLIGRESKKLLKGLNKVTYNGWARLGSGMYFTRFVHNQSVILRKVTKM